MRYINIFLCVMMLLFIVVQYNDPDGPLWAAIYLVPAVLAAVAGFGLSSRLGGATSAILGLVIFVMLLLTVYYFPKTPGFWHKDVWWETETAREGMGMMIAFVVTLIASYSIWQGRTRS